MPEYRVCAQQQIIQTWRVVANDPSAAARRIRELRHDASPNDAQVESEEHTETTILWVEDDEGEPMEFIEEENNGTDDPSGRHGGNLPGPPGPEST